MDRQRIRDAGFKASWKFSFGDERKLRLLSSGCWVNFFLNQSIFYLLMIKQSRPFVLRAILSCVVIGIIWVGVSWLIFHWQQKRHENLFWLEIIKDILFGSITAVFVLISIKTLWRQQSAANSLLQATLDSTSDGILVVDTSGKITNYNRRFCDLWRVSEKLMRTGDYSKALGTVLEQLSDPEKFIAKVKSLYDEPEANSFDEINFKDGRIFERTSQPQRIEGKVVGRVWNFHDVTEERRSRSEIQFGEDRYRTLFDFSPAGFLRQDPEGKIIDANETICRLTGYSRPEIVGQTTEIFTTPDAAKLVENHRKKILAGGIHVHEVENLTSDGHIIFVKIVETCVTFPDGRREILCNVTDVTERRKTERLLEKQKQILELVATGSPLAVNLEHLCEMVEWHSDEALASILLLDKDGKHLRHGAAPSLAEDYCQKIDGVEIGPAVGSCGTAAFLKQQIIVEDIATSPLWANFSGLALLHGLRACWSTPIFDAQKNLLGTFAIYSKQPGKPSVEQLRIVELTTHIAALAISRQHEEVQLRQAEESYRNFFNTISDAIYVLDESGKFIAVNEGAVTMYGRAKDEFIGKTPEFLSAPGRNDLQANVSAIQKAFAGERQKIEWWGLRKNGEVFPKEVQLVKGTYFGQSVVFVTGRDITERYRAQEKIFREEARFKLIFDTVPIGIAFHTTRPDGTITRNVNDAHLRICGITREQSNDTTIYNKITHPDDREAKKEFIKAAQAREGKVYSFEMRYIHSGTKVTWVSLSYQREVYPDGTVEELTTVTDITGLKASEKSVRESEEQMRVMFELSPDAIFVESYDGYVLDVNAAACRLHGLPREKLVGMTALELVPTQDQPKVKANFSLLGTEKLKIADGFSLRADGQKIPVEVIASRISYAGQPAILINARDVSERKRLEEELRQSQKMEAIGQLSGGIAHDFNNILTAIIGNTTLLEDLELRTSEAQECLQEINRAACRAADLTRQLLLFSRKQTMKTTAVDMNQVVRHSAKMLQRILGEDITLSSEFSDGLPTISADSSMVEQAILNLAVNARDAMPSGGKLQLVTSLKNIGNPDAGKNLEPSPHVCLAIIDDGIGIAPEVLPQIFEPFFTTKEVGKGTGLGLATVYGIIKQHNGWLAVSSKLGKGTCVEIYFPARCENQTATPELSATPQLPRGSGTILIVEDEPPVRHLLSVLLNKLGYQVITAVNGVEAIKVWREHREKISLLITDVIMPGGMNGQQLANQIQGEAPDLKVLFISGYTGTPSDSGVQLVEGENFIRKPFAPHALARMVSEKMAPSKKTVSDEIQK